MPTTPLLVCRCEEVTDVDLSAAYHAGCTTSRQLKMQTRVTMGACQGRICRYLVEAWLHHQNPAAPDDASQLSYRPPVRPVTFGQLAEGEES